MDLEPVFHWCGVCRHPVYLPHGNKCPTCGEKLVYLTTDARPVFARERRVLQFYGHGPLTTDAVWRASKSRYYYINGKQVSLPESETLKKDLPMIADYIRDSNHYDALDEQLIQDYQRQLQVNRPHLLSLEDEAFQFIQHSVRRFSRRLIMVSFSGGKDSTVVSDLVRRALGHSDIYTFLVILLWKTNILIIMFALSKNKILLSPFLMQELSTTSMSLLTKWDRPAV